MECRGHVVVGYLRRYGTNKHVLPLFFCCIVISALTLFELTCMNCFVLSSAPFAATRSMNPRLNTKPIHRRPTITAFPLPLEIADTSFTWIVFNDGSKHVPFVPCVTRNGILQSQYFVCLFGCCFWLRVLLSVNLTRSCITFSFFLSGLLVLDNCVVNLSIFFFVYLFLVLSCFLSGAHPGIWTVGNLRKNVSKHGVACWRVVKNSPW